MVLEPVDREAAGTWGERFGWVMYDFANTPFSVMIVTFVYSVYFKDVVASGLGNMGDLLWGLSGAISMISLVALGPLLGAIADFSGGKKRFLIAFSLLCIGFTALLATVGQGMVLRAMCFFIVANIGFQGAIVFYNAFLPEITGADTYGRLSGYGYAAGYVGAILILWLCSPLLQEGFAPANLPRVRLCFLITACFFFVFALPLFVSLRERTGPAARREHSYLAAGFRRLLHTFRNLRHYRQLLTFILAYFLYIQGVVTVTYFASIYARNTLHFTLPELAFFAFAILTAGAVGSVAFGRVADRILPKRTITVTLLLWCIVIVGAATAEAKEVFFATAILAGVAMGSSQSVSRHMMALLTPPDKRAEFFGFYSVSDKLSASFGPLAFGIISVATGSQRFALLCTLVFFVGGLMVLQHVDEAEGIASGRPATTGAEPENVTLP